ncbi:hypothetical protein Tdes44962_MAKER04905 [Teratosphaeria destructans]|uniref:Uncharacterized protein n=1 Tax=Teratosphaeria destructans TaxID=418781 RepID=A0A9W7VZK0_9PEZI|nr:hypothetical protein Tdes44962_MAKER04905 [Teratosphaeria destructans]
MPQQQQQMPTRASSNTGELDAGTDSQTSRAATNAATANPTSWTAENETQRQLTQGFTVLQIVPTLEPSQSSSWGRPPRAVERSGSPRKSLTNSPSAPAPAASSEDVLSSSLSWEDFVQVDADCSDIRYRFSSGKLVSVEKLLDDARSQV